MTFKNLLFNNLEIRQTLELHVSKEEFIERIRQLTRKNLFNGKFEPEAFRLTPRPNLLDSYSFFDTQIVGKIKEENPPIKIELTIKRTSFFRFFLIFVDCFLLAFGIGIVVSGNNLQEQPILLLMLFICILLIRYLFNDRLHKSEKIFLEYLSQLFTSHELSVIND